MQTTVTAAPKMATRIRPTPQVCVRPAPEVVTTHAAACPECGRETRVGLGASGIVFGACMHFREIHQIGVEVRVLFEVTSAEQITAMKAAA